MGNRRRCRKAVKYPGCSKAGLCTPLGLCGEEQSGGGQVAGFSQVIVSNRCIDTTPGMTHNKQPAHHCLSPGVTLPTEQS